VKGRSDFDTPLQLSTDDIEQVLKKELMGRKTHLMTSNVHNSEGVGKRNEILEFE